MPESSPLLGDSGAAPLWQPPTPTPEAGQGPWCDLRDLPYRWWVVASTPQEALAAVWGCDGISDVYGEKITMEKVAIRWVDPADWNEEYEIREVGYEDGNTAEAWRIGVSDGY